MLGHVAFIVMLLMHSSLYWNGVMYTAIVSVLCYVYTHMVTSTVSGSIDHAALYKCQIKYSPLAVQPGRSVCVCVCTNRA